MFCQWSRKIGFTTWLCPWMEVNHVGTYVFNGTLKDLGRLEFAAHGVDSGRPLKEERKESRKERRKAERVEKKKGKKVYLTTPEG